MARKMDNFMQLTSISDIEGAISELRLCVQHEEKSENYPLEVCMVARATMNCIFDYADSHPDRPIPDKLQAVALSSMGFAVDAVSQYQKQTRNLIVRDKSKLVTESVERQIAALKTLFTKGRGAAYDELRDHLKVLVQQNSR